MAIDNFSKILTDRVEKSTKKPSSDGNVVLIGTSFLIDNPYQPRTVYRHIEELSDSIIQNGQIQPIMIAPVPDQEGKYYIVAGHRRVRAVKQAGIMQIRAVIRNDLDSEKLETIALAENIHRDKLSPAEIVIAIKSIMIEHPEMMKRDIAKKLSMSAGALSNYIKALDIPNEDLVRLKKAGAKRDMLVIIAKASDLDFREKAITAIENNQEISVKEVKKIVGIKEKSGYKIVSNPTSTTIYFGTCLNKEELKVVEKELALAMKKAKKIILDNRNK